jgi:NitT/TauT family transport system substrate-binding protein
MSARTKTLVSLLGAVVALGLAACGDDDDDGGSGGSGGGAEPASLTVATPYPSGIAFPELFVANARGYFDEEQLEVEVEPLDGSGSTLQALETGQVDVAIPSPGPIIQAAQRGGNPLSVYTSYQDGIFSLLTSSDSGISSLEDLEGETVGVSALDGGEVPVVKAMLGEAGLEEGDGYKLLAVGDGGTASTALEKGDVAAYGANFADALILEGAGIDVVDLTPTGFNGGTDTHYVVDASLRDDDPELITRFGRALARASEWLHANPDRALDLICKEFPEECEDREFAQQIFDAVIELETLPDSAQGQWGYTDLDRIQEFADVLLEQEELQQQADVSEMFTDEFVADFNEPAAGG